MPVIDAYLIGYKDASVQREIERDMKGKGENLGLFSCRAVVKRESGDGIQIQ